MKGMIFKLDHESMEKNGTCTSLGWERIEIVERYLSSIFINTAGQRYIYTLICKCSSNDDIDIIHQEEDEFMEEVGYGIYKYIEKGE